MKGSQSLRLNSELATKVRRALGVPVPERACCAPEPDALLLGLILAFFPLYSATFLLFFPFSPPFLPPFPCLSFFYPALSAFSRNWTHAYTYAHMHRHTPTHAHTQRWSYFSLELTFRRITNTHIYFFLSKNIFQSMSQSWFTFRLKNILSYFLWLYLYLQQ